MTQRELASKAGVTGAYVAQLETGTKKNPSLDVLTRLAKVLGARVTDLLG
jgi:transcriptional regulator with XRE-family HTH domain